MQASQAKTSYGWRRELRSPSVTVNPVREALSNQPVATAAGPTQSGVFNYVRSPPRSPTISQMAWQELQQYTANYAVSPLQSADTQPTGTPAGAHTVPGNSPGTGIDIPVPIPQTLAEDAAPPQPSLPLPVNLAPSPSMHSPQSIYSAKIPNHNPIVSNHRRVVEAMAKLKFASQSDDSFGYFHVQNGHLCKL